MSIRLPVCMYVYACASCSVSTRNLGVCGKGRLKSDRERETERGREGPSLGLSCQPPSFQRKTSLQTTFSRPISFVSNKKISDHRTGSFY